MPEGLERTSIALACAAGLCLAAACGADSGNDGVPKLDAGPGTGGTLSNVPADMHAGGSGGMTSSGMTGSGGMTVSSGSGGRDGMMTPGMTMGSGGSASMMHDAGPPIDAGMAQPYDLDCGTSGVALEGHGPPANRINYVIVGDGYDEADLDGIYLEHVQKMLDGRFRPEQEPYLRYRNFVNICALKVKSNQSGIGESAGDTAFHGYGNDESRLGYIEDNLVQDAIKDLLPAEIEVDWTSVVLNDDRWWNSGGRLMVWSGGHRDAALAAQHEGGHAFQRLADEYGGDCTFSDGENGLRINVTTDSTGAKWKQWLGFDQDPGTGMQGTFEGAQYCDKGVWRPSQDSVMNQLSRSPYFNSISLEQAVRIIYEKVKPIDSSTPSDTTAPGVLEVQVVDPQVIAIDWSVDGDVVAEGGGGSFDVSKQGLASGSHMVEARAHDDTEWVTGDRSALEQTVQWTIMVP